jgi:hypothetical protein
MAKEFRCPEDNLETILRVYNEALFFIVFRKPNKEKIRESLEREVEPVFDFEPNLDYEIDRMYEEQMKRYQQFKRERELVLTTFGLNEDEIQDDLEGFYNKSLGILRRHVEIKCPRCKSGYLGLGTGYIEELLSDYNGFSREKAVEHDPEQRIKEVEGMYLGSMNFDPDNLSRFEVQLMDSNPRRPR